VRNVNDVPEVRDRAGLVVARVVLWAALGGGTLAFGAVQAWMWAGMYTLAAVALLCWAFTCWREGAVRLIWTPLYVPAGLFLVFAVWQWGSGRTGDPIAGREAILHGIGTALVFFLGLNLFATESQRTWRRVGWSVTLFAFALAVFAIVQFFSDPERLYWTVKPRFGGYIFGPYVNHNHYAGMMEMLVGVALAFSFTLRNGAQRVVAGFAVLVAISSVVLSGSRAGTTALMIEGVLFAVLIARRRWRGSALVVFAIAVVLASLWLLPDSVAERLTTVAHTDVSYTTRKALTLDSLRIFRDHPATGAGLGAFEAVYPRYQSIPSDLLLDFAHNDYAQLLAETGIAGAVLALLTLFLFFRAFRLALRSGFATQPSWISAGAFIGCTGLLVHSWMDFNLHIPANAAWFAFLAGLAQTYVIDAPLARPYRMVGRTVVERGAAGQDLPQREPQTLTSRMFWSSNN
jgi:O-antigen ligase